MANIEHKDITGANMHPPYNWSFTNATTRAAAGTFVTGDIGKWAYQQSDSTIWQLASFDGGGVPTWTAVAATGSGMSNPMTTLDDIIVGGASGTPARLAKGSGLLGVDPVTGHVGYVSPLWLPQGTYLRGYTFDTTVEGWTGEGTVSQSGGQLQMLATANNQSAVEPASPTGGTVQHGEVRADISSNGAAYGIIWRYQDVNNYYLMDIMQTGAVHLYRKSAGSYTDIGTCTSNPGYGPHRVMVRFVGSHFWFYINDAFVGQIDESNITAAGRVGIFVFSGTVSLDAMRVYSLSSSWAPSGL